MSLCPYSHVALSGLIEDVSKNPRKLPNYHNECKTAVMFPGAAAAYKKDRLAVQPIPFLRVEFILQDCEVSDFLQFNLAFVFLLPFP